MNYEYQYFKIISNRVLNPISKSDCYCEEHHIIPKSEGGLDTKDNIVNLTAREHYIAHLLLAKIYNDRKMLSAVIFMLSGRHRNRKFKFNSHLYKKLREQFGLKQKTTMLGVNKGIKRSIEFKHKISIATSGKNNPMYGKHHTSNAKLKISKCNKGKQAWNRKTVFQFSKDGRFIKKWSSATEVQHNLGFKQNAISMCCNGTLKTAYGYVWKYTMLV